MKAFYYDHFHIPKQGKIREKVLMSHVVLTAVLIIVYLLAISGSAYAFFTSTQSVHNTLVAAHFDAQIHITDEYGNEVGTELQPDGVLLAVLEAPGAYVVTVTPDGTAETGFCAMQLEGEDYTTAQLGVSMEAADGYRDEVTFTIQAYEPVPVAFQPYWGTSAAYADYSMNGIAPDGYLLGGEYIEAGDPANMWLYLEEEPEEETEEAEEDFEEAPEEDLLEDLEAVPEAVPEGEQEEDLEEEPVENPEESLEEDLAPAPEPEPDDPNTPEETED
ncbi:MAG: hypothetical protein IJO88_08985 [Oscillospiraceae bacterium]|nr:hypothetical protein [Oscillospiraceae bacterium]